MRRSVPRAAVFILSLLIFNNSILHEQSAAEPFYADLTIDPPFMRADSAWVDSIMSDMSLDDKIAQMLMIQAYSNRGEDHVHDLERLIRRYNVGGVIFFQGGPLRQANMTNRFQSASRIPLLIGMDAEWGPGMRLDSTISYPRQMVLGAVPDNQLIYRMGTGIARQLKILGVHINFAPVADINNNPANPVIGTRSFGEDRENVTQKVIAYMRGMQDEGILVTAKHFPGHGDTDSDSHKTLPLIPHSMERLDSVELYPFRKAIENGLSGIMVAHLQVPALDDREDRATTLSASAVNGLLKERMGFKGLIVTDALNMNGVSDHFGSGDLELEAVLAGNDILLMPSDVPKVIRTIRQAVRKNLVTEDEIDARCRKILMAKAWMGLTEKPVVETDSLAERINDKQFQVLRHRLVEDAITLVKNEDDLLPFKDLTFFRPATLNIGSAGRDEFQSVFDLYHSAAHFYVPDTGHLSELEVAAEQLKECNALVVNFYTLDDAGAGGSLTGSVRRFLDTVNFEGDLVLNFFTYPYALGSFGDIDMADAVVISYTDDSLNQRYAAQGIFGGSQLKGRLPVSVDGIFRSGQGITTTPAKRLKYSFPESVDMDSDTLLLIDHIVREAIRAKAMPGCQVLVARRGEVIYNRSFGYHTFRNRTPVRPTDVYDLASVTKIASTVPSLIRLQSEGLFSPDDSLGNYFPGIDTSAKSDLTFREILAHQAGLKAWIPFYTSTLEVLDTSQTLFSTKFSYAYPYRLGPAAYANRNIRYKDSVYTHAYDLDYPVQVADGMYLREGYQDSIYRWILESPLGEKKYRYSDLGYYFMYRMVENLTDTLFYPYNWYNFYGPLGAETLGFLPLNRYGKERIVPTENDMVFRRQLVHGHVHDPGAAMLGGVAGHAGLFSNANDLAKLMQMYLNNGEYGGRRYLDSATLVEYTRCQFCENENRRAMGFDRPLEGEEEGPATREASPRSYGHSGFTGTLVWMDPEYDLLYVFLSNRVFPDQDNTTLITMDVRTNIQQVLYRAITDRKVPVQDDTEVNGETSGIQPVDADPPSE